MPGHVKSEYLIASTTQALKSMYRVVQEKGHALQLVESTSPCWVRLGLAATKAEIAAKKWKVGLPKTDTQVAAHMLSAQLYSRSHPPVKRELSSRRGNEEKIEASHLCKIPGFEGLAASTLTPGSTSSRGARGSPYTRRCSGMSGFSS